MSIRGLFAGGKVVRGCQWLQHPFSEISHWLELYLYSPHVPSGHLLLLSLITHYMVGLRKICVLNPYISLCTVLETRINTHSNSCVLTFCCTVGKFDAVWDLSLLDLYAMPTGKLLLSLQAARSWGCVLSADSFRRNEGRPWANSCLRERLLWTKTSEVIVTPTVDALWCLV
jgi:hypothetical protein